MLLPHILHLVDDASPGGVTRVLQHLSRCPHLAAFACHRVGVVRRGALRPPDLTAADLIVSHLSLSWRTLPALAALRATAGLRPLVHVEHSYSAGFETACVPARTRFRTMLRLGFGLCDRVVAVSAGQADWMRGARLLPAARLQVIPSTVNLDAFAALPAASHPPRVIGALGRFDRQKGFDILIRAFRNRPHAPLQLRLIGDGPEAPALRTLAAGDPRIRFSGFTDDPAAAMAGLDAVAMPSRWEPYGLVALEARAAGRLLLAAPVDGLGDHIRDGALAVRDSSEAGWAAALDALTDMAPGPRVARARAAALGADRAFAQGWADLVQDCLPATRTPGTVLA